MHPLYRNAEIQLYLKAENGKLSQGSVEMRGETIRMNHISLELSEAITRGRRYRSALQMIATDEFDDLADVQVQAKHILEHMDNER